MSVFAQGSVLKGKLILADTFAGDPDDNDPNTVAKLIQSESSSWDEKTTGTARTQISLQVKVLASYDLDGVGRYVVTRHEPVDDFGNVLETLSFRIGGGPGGSDEVRTFTEYAEPVSGSEVHDRPSLTYTDYLTSSGSYAEIARKSFYYDGESGGDPLDLGQVATGNVRRVESQIDANGGTVSTRNEYNHYGNITHFYDERGNLMQTFYDGAQLYPYVEFNAKGQVRATQMEYRYGKPIEVVDPNSAVTLYDYDDAGRIKCVAKPGDSLEDCSEKYSYEWNYLSTSGDSRMRAVIERKEPMSPTGYVTSVAHFDALGRPRYRTSERVVGGPEQSPSTIVSGRTDYDKGGRIATQYAPYLASAGDPDQGMTKYEYDLNGSGYIDPLGRPHKITKVDGTSVTMEYHRGSTTYYDEAGNKSTKLVDAYGRPTREESYDDTGALYAWKVTTYDGAGRVLTTTQNDNPATTISFAYDWLGRKKVHARPRLGRLDLWICSSREPSVPE